MEEMTISQWYMTCIIVICVIILLIIPYIIVHKLCTYFIKRWLKKKEKNLSDFGLSEMACDYIWINFIGYILTFVFVTYPTILLFKDLNI